MPDKEKTKNLPESEQPYWGLKLSMSAQNVLLIMVDSGGWIDALYKKVCLKWGLEFEKLYKRCMLSI